MKYLLFFSLGFVLSFVPFAGSAQDSPAPSGNSAVVDQAAPDMPERLSLAQRMHAIHPAARQIDSAIAYISQNLPPAERAAFRVAMQSALDYDALESHSVEAMAQTYTLAELEAMVAYHEKPEAKSASAKTDIYFERVQPVITRMLDEAMMKTRTGEKLR